MCWGHSCRSGLATKDNAWTRSCVAGMSFLAFPTQLRLGVCVWHVWRDVKLLFIAHGSAAWLWNRTQRSYHNHGISKLITSTYLPSKWNLHGGQQMFGCPLGFLLSQAVASYWWKHVVASWHLMCLVLKRVCVCVHLLSPNRSKTSRGHGN